LRIRINDMRSKALGLAADEVTIGERTLTLTGTVNVTDRNDDPNDNPSIPTGSGQVNYDSDNNQWSVTIGGFAFTSTNGATFTYTAGNDDEISFTLSEALTETDTGTIEIAGNTVTYTSTRTVTGTNHGLEAGVYKVVS